MSSDNKHNSEAHTDRILFLYSESLKNWEKYYNSLKNKKNYEVELYEEGHVTLVPKFTFDLVVLCLDSDQGTLDALSELRKLFLAPSTPCIILTPSGIPVVDLSAFPSVQHLSYEDEISRFLVVISVQLRLRKIRSSHIKSQVEVVSENATLRDLNNRFQRDLIEAREIHEKLLPNSLPDFEKIKCFSSYLPLELVGGDLFDIWKEDTNRAGVFLGDITGHGLPAAFIASMTKMCFALSPFKSPDAGLDFLNKKLSGYLPDGRFITAINCSIDADNMTLSYCNAGHPPPLLYRKSSKEVITLGKKGMPLNVDVDFEYKATDVSISSGDMLLIYSDGLYETVSMDNKIMGLVNLTEKFLEFASTSNIEDTIHSIMDYQKEFTGGRMYRDDVTIIGIEIL